MEKSIEKFTKELEKLWFDKLEPKNRFNHKDNGCIKVSVWKEEPEGEEPYWCEGYALVSGILTGRGGFILFRDLIIKDYKTFFIPLTLNGKNISLKKLYDVLEYTKEERKTR